MFIKLITFSALISVGLTITVPKSALVRLCETARSARDSGLEKDKMYELVVADLNVYLNSNVTGLTRYASNVKVTIKNTGCLNLANVFVMEPSVSVDMGMDVLSDMMNGYYAKKPGKPISPSSFKPTANSVETEKDSVGGTIEQILSTSLSTPAQCSELDLPESIDLDNSAEVRKTILKIALQEYKKRDQKIAKLVNLIKLAEAQLY